MKKSNIKSLVFSIITVLAIIAIVGGSTYAYFQWTTSDDQRTNVNVVIEHGSIVMTISPENTTFTGLRPTNNCHTRAAYADALVKVENGTGTVAIPSFKLKVRVDQNGSDPLTKAALSHINYSVVPLMTRVDASGNIIKVEAGASCGSYESKIDNLGGELFQDTKETDYLNSHLWFESVSTDGSWTHVPQCGDSAVGGIYGNEDSVILNGADCGYLPRQYYLEGTANHSKGSVGGITFKAYSGGTTYQYYRVYVWIDEGYTATAVGNVVSDPLQDATIYVTWSEESTIQQVDGVFTPGDNYVSNAPAMTYEISGVWEFNDTLDFPDTYIEEFVSFDGMGGFVIDSYALSYHSMNPPAGPPDTWAYNDGGETLWYYSDKTVDFGEEPQVVSQEFYEWFTANATKQS